jgi:hypothetical protein
MERKDRQSFNCPVLGGVALIEITKRYTVVDQLPQPLLSGTDFTGCANVLQCGIARQTSPGIFVPDWTLCPAHPDFKGRLSRP